MLLCALVAMDASKESLGLTTIRAKKAGLLFRAMTRWSAAHKVLGVQPAMYDEVQGKQLNYINQSVASLDRLIS